MAIRYSPEEKREAARQAPEAMKGHGLYGETKAFSKEEKSAILEGDFEKLQRAERQKRKPSGKAKEAVTLRLSKDCVSSYLDEHGDEWRAIMQQLIEAGRPKGDQ